MGFVEFIDPILIAASQASPFRAGSANIVRVAHDLNFCVLTARGTQTLADDACHIGGESIGISFALKAKRTKEVMWPEL